MIDEIAHKKRTDFDSFLSHLSEVLQSTPLNQIKPCLTDVLQETIKYLELDRVSLFPESLDLIQRNQLISANQHGIPKVPKVASHIEIAPYLNFLKEQNCVFRFDQYEIVSSDLAVIQLLRDQGIHSHYIIPINIFGKRWGTISLAQFTAQKANVSNNVLRQLSIVGEICACHWQLANLCLEKESEVDLKRTVTNKLAHLTAKQKKVISLLSAGFTAKEIGEQLCLSARTVESHKYRAMKILDLHGHIELMRFSLQHQDIINKCL